MKQDKNFYILAIVLGVLAILLSTCLGALAGGLVGYWAGRRAATAVIPLPLPEEKQPTPIVPQKPQPTPPESLPWKPVVNGALITRVVDDSPADEAGIKPGDVIIAVDGKRVTEENALDQIIRGYRPGDKVEITLWRGARERSLKVKLGSRPEDPGIPYLGVYYIPFISVQRPGGD
ncbi:MAG: PDZ domain-containing protein [Chloroflexi bacterium]|nr:PDZ domain-containing protein [Chloroflexota bacterium]